MRVASDLNTNDSGNYCAWLCLQFKNLAGHINYESSHELIFHVTNVDEVKSLNRIPVNWNYSLHNSTGYNINIAFKLGTLTENLCLFFFFN